CSMPWWTTVGPAPPSTTRWSATLTAPGDFWRHVHATPGSTAVTSHTTLGRRGCLISNRLPTSLPGPPRAALRALGAVPSAHSPTAAYPPQPPAAGPSISTLLSTIMYQMVHNLVGGLKWSPGTRPRRVRLTKFASRRGPEVVSRRGSGTRR